MKKNIFLLFLFYLLSACTNNLGDSDIKSVDSSVSFISTIGMGNRATDIQFETGDKISVFATMDRDINRIGNYAENEQYTYINNTFIASGNGIGLSDSDKKVCYHAVYPYLLDMKEKFTFRVMENQKSHEMYTFSDLMLAEKEVDSGTQMVPLEFKHCLSKIVINVQHADLPTNDIDMRLIDIFTEIDIDINKKTIQLGYVKSNLSLGSDGTNRYKAILPPQGWVSGSIVAHLTKGDETYNIKLLHDVSFKSGSESTLYLVRLASGYALTADEDYRDNEVNTIVGAWQSELHPNRIWIFNANGQVYSESEGYGQYTVENKNLHITWKDEYGYYDEDFLIMELTSSIMILDEVDEGCPHNDPEKYVRVE